MSTVKAISLWQPWAQFMVQPVFSELSGRPIILKRIETRSWPTKHRGRLLIHAAKYKGPDVGPIYENPNVRLWLQRMGRDQYGRDLPRGAIIGEVHVTCCDHTEELDAWTIGRAEAQLGNYDVGRFGWGTDPARAKLYPEPIPYRGRQQLFDVPVEILP